MYNASKLNEIVGCYAPFTVQKNTNVEWLTACKGGSAYIGLSAPM
jgi:drug/metabolite transporter superfamily protein YnfA